MRGWLLPAGLLIALGSALPGQASRYSVRVGGPAVGDAPSRFTQIDFASSRFEPKPRSGGTAGVPGGSSFALKGLTSEARRRTEANLSVLGARQEGSRILVDLPSDVLFDFDKSVIRAEARPALARLAEVLGTMPRAQVVITGHTDALGSETYNQVLSERRAKAVRSWLVRRGIPAGRLSAAGKGESAPAAPNAHPDGSDDPVGRQRNRRVAFLIEPDR